jgi:hypothetical protein
MTEEQEITDAHIHAGHVTLSLLSVAVIALVAWQFYTVWKGGNDDGPENEPTSIRERAS